MKSFGATPSSSRSCRATRFPMSKTSSPGPRPTPSSGSIPVIPPKWQLKQIRGAEAAMPKSGALPSSLLYELPACVLIVDAAGDLQLVTRRAEELLGLAFDEIAAGLRDPGTSKP